MLFGSGLLTPAIQATANALLTEELPVEWAKLWEGPEDPRGWLRGVVVRRLALAKWYRAGAEGTLLRSALNLGELFRPGTFLNALRQQTARNSGISMDQLKLTSCWDPKLVDQGVPVQLSGLMLQVRRGCPASRVGFPTHPCMYTHALYTLPPCLISALI